MRWGKWKLVREYQKSWELYDIESDRAEMHDLAEREPERRQQMIDLWTQWAGQHDVAFPERFNMYEFLKKRQTQ